MPAIWLTFDDFVIMIEKEFKIQSVSLFWSM